MTVFTVLKHNPEITTVVVLTTLDSKLANATADKANDTNDSYTKQLSEYHAKYNDFRKPFIEKWNKSFQEWEAISEIEGTVWDRHLLREQFKADGKLIEERDDAEYHRLYDEFHKANYFNIFSNEDSESWYEVVESELID